jgi:hypothetical protein
MATKKTKKKHTKIKKTAAHKRSPSKHTVKKKLTQKKTARKKNLAKKKPAPKKSAAKTKALRKKTTGASRSAMKPIRGKTSSTGTATFMREGQRTRSGGQSGDLQGLSNVEGADSESVDELLEEGNAFEAEVVAGVEDAGDFDERGVRTHEVPEDDVPGEYLDEE